MSTPAASLLEPQGHFNVVEGSVRPRTRSINTDHNQFQLQETQLQQQQPPQKGNESHEISLPSTAAPDQINQSMHQAQAPPQQASSMPSFTNTESSDHSSRPTSFRSGRQFALDLTLAGSHSYAIQQESSHRMASASNTYSNVSGSPAIVLANNNSTFTTPNSSNPLQHRPHTPLKSSFGATDHLSDNVTISPSSSSSSSTHVGGGGGFPPKSSVGTSFENITTLSTKAGRKHFTDNEKHLGPLPTIHSSNGRGRQEVATIWGVSLKHLSLVVLLLQNSVLVLMMRYSRVSVDPDQPMYLASTAVFIAEIIKLCACFLILVFKTGSVPRTLYIIRKEILEQPHEILKMLVPSGLYALQNNLLYIALSNLEAATFQVTYQMKILSTAIFSVVMLNRRLTRQKWLSLCLLMVGVTLVQLQNVGTAKSIAIIDASTNEEGELESLSSAAGESIAEADNQLSANSEDESAQNPIIGLLAVLTSCVSSGFAGCYFEKILKGSECDMWVRNLQLGISGSLFSFLAMFYDRQKIYEGGVFQGYSMVTWMVITNQALGGLMVAIVVKYADNILKGFATSLSIIISGMISVYFFDFEPSIQFQLGTLVVILATFLYGRPDAPIPRFIRPQKK
ncbi:hypothetical protein BGZ58_003126 [Dissophora ornata]|nr:hypothetical protein BGZ58_003126 [Dissophora ornata]